MSCGFAVMHYAICRHNQLFKIACTKDCGDFCDEPQEILLETGGYFRCRSCARADDVRIRSQRSTVYERERIAARRVAQSHPRVECRAALQTVLQLNVRVRHEWHAGRHRVNHRVQLYEVLDAERWTAGYAEILWQLRHGSGEEVQTPDVVRELAGILDALNETIPEGLDVFREISWGDEDSGESCASAMSEEGCAAAEEQMGESDGSVQSETRTGTTISLPSSPPSSPPEEIRPSSPLLGMPPALPVEQIRKFEASVRLPLSPPAELPRPRTPMPRARLRLYAATLMPPPPKPLPKEPADTLLSPPPC